MNNLELYYYDECPFCQKVLKFIKAKGIEVTYKNIKSDKGAREELLNVGGKTQVPCLFIDGAALYESSDIIAWLEKNA